MHNALRNDLPDWLLSLSYDVLADAARVLEGTRWLMVGALARDYAFRDSDDLKTLRATMDVDVAVLVSNWNEFDDVVSRLCHSGRFRRTAGPHRLVHAHGQQMDILPFGGLEQDHHIAWPPDGEPEMNVMGFCDALAASHHVSLPGGIEIRIAPAAAVVLLKMVAWHDNPSNRERDIEDIAGFIKGYITEIVGWDDAYAAHRHVMTADNFDLEEAGAHALGADISSLLSGNIRAQVIAIAEKTADDHSTFADRLGFCLNTSHEHALRICSRLLAGLQQRTTEKGQG